MKQFPLVQVGNPAFRQPCLSYSPEEILSPSVQATFARMKYTMRRVHGVGLAAPQVGLQKQLFVMRLKPTKYRPDIPHIPPYVVINPEIVQKNKILLQDWEGCFSIAGADLFAKVPRASSIKVKYLNEQAQVVERELEGLEARVFQHEYDHLIGKTFLEVGADCSTIMSRKEYQDMRAKISQ